MTTNQHNPTRSTQRFSNWANKHRKWILASPAMAFIGILIVFPLAWTAWMSLTDSSGSVRKAYNIIGLENYAGILTDTQRFWPAVLRTVAFTLGALALELVAGMCIALLLRKPFRGQGLVRVAILLPLVATPVAVGMVWRLILDPNIGLANQLLGTVGIPPMTWLGDVTSALPTLILIDAWQWTPMVAIILLAGLTVVPDEVDEAAQVDGANGWQRFWRVTLPLLWPTLVTAVLLRSIDAMKTFDLLYATKGKGGGSFHEVETLNIYAYTLTFDYNEYGRAYTVVVLFLLLIIAAIALISVRRKGGGQS
jgi:multiple sugar transport system permease protein